MNERIKKLRRILNLTQREFGERIGVKPNTIATYEIGRNEPIDAVISLICREFNVSEAWLRTGEGGMFIPDTKDALGAFIRERNLTSTDRILIEKFVSLSTKARWEVVKYVLDIADMLWEECKTSVQQKAEPELATKVAELERQNRELVAKVAAMEKEDARIDAAVFYVPWFFQPMSAGTGEEAGREDPEPLAIKKAPPKGTSFVARVKGNSMEPTYQDGDLVFVKAQPEVEPGEIGAFYMDGQMWIKERGDGVLISHNPEYDPKPVTESVRCQGLVLGACDESYFE